MHKGWSGMRVGIKAGGKGGEEKGRHGINNA